MSKYLSALFVPDVSLAVSRSRVTDTIFTRPTARERWSRGAGETSSAWSCPCFTLSSAVTLQADHRTTAEWPRWPRKRRSQRHKPRPRPSQDPPPDTPWKCTALYAVLKQLYHKERVKCVSIHASGVVRQSERWPFPPDHFFSLSSFVLCLVWMMIHVVVFVCDSVLFDFWKLLESGPPKTRRLKACFSFLRYSAPRLRYPENRNPAFEASPDWDHLNTTVCIGNPCRIFLSQTSACLRSDMQWQNECVHAMPC